MEPARPRPGAAPADGDGTGSVDQALAAAAALGLPRLTAQWLLAHHLQRPRSWLLAHGDDAVSAAARTAFDAGCARLAAGVPLAHLTGWRGFHGLQLAVTPDVLDPRPDTEALVDWALALLQGPAAPLADRGTPRVLDLGTGSGAVALAVKAGCPRAAVTATDASAAALAVARDNAQRLGLVVEFLQGHWWQPLAGRPGWDLVLSNPPYLGADDPHLPALRHEPHTALVPAGGAALADLEHLVDHAPAHLRPGGWLLLEHGHDQGPAVTARLRAHGFAVPGQRHDLAGHWRCSGGRWDGAGATHPPGSGP
jgi:release factor glutamine methyltransferase